MDIFNLVGRIAIDGISNVQSQISGVIGQAQNAGTALGLAFQKIGSNIASLGTKLTDDLTRPLVKLTLFGVKYNASMEMMQTNFEVLLQSGEKATALIKKLSDMADRTPFDTEGLAQYTQMLLSMGYTGDNVLPMLQRLGDICLGNKDKMGRLTYAVGQIRSSGKLMGTELRQLTELGFNPLEIIIGKTGETMDQARKRMSDGKISYKEFEETLIAVTEKGGNFFEGMNKGSKTFTGMLSTVMDKANKMAGIFSKPIFDKLKAILPNIIDLITKFSDGFTKLDDDTKTIILVIGGLVAGIGPLLVVFGTLIGFCGFVVTGISTIVAGFGTFISILGAILSPIGIAITAIVGLALIFGGLLLASNDVRDGITNVFNGIVEKIRSAVEWVKIHLTDIQNAFSGFFAFISSGNYDQSFENLRNALYNMFPDHKKKIDDLLFNLGQIVTKAGEVTTWIETVGIPTLERWWDKFVIIANQIKTDFTPTIEACKGLISKLGETVSTTADLIVQLSENSDKGEKSVDSFANAGKKGKSSMKDLADSLTEIVNGLSTVVGWFNKTIDAIISADKWCKNFSKSASEAINKIPLLGGLYKGADKLLGFADGTNYAPGGLAMVGENGPEILSVPRGSRIYTAQQTKSMLSSSTPTNENKTIYQNFNISLNVEKLKDLMTWEQFLQIVKSESVARGGAY